MSSTDQVWHWRGLDAQGQLLELRDIPLLDLPMEKLGNDLAGCLESL